MNKPPIHVLLADDDEDDRMIFKDALEEIKLKIKVTMVTDGIELMDYLEKFEIAMNKTRAVQRSWQQTMQQIRESTEKLMQPHAQTAAH